jgi:crotonobetainyl-CoA:carnitine CoA-transferase CaiB-like acyl-CoA transferase
MPMSMRKHRKKMGVPNLFKLTGLISLKILNYGDKGGLNMKKKTSLDGIRVLDFTWSVAGPTMTRMLASLGAEVIKVEWPSRPDPMRTAMYDAGETKKGLNNGAFFSGLNIGKKSFTINVRSKEGFEIVERLIQSCDLIAESYSSKVFESWGLSYEKLREINPRIVYISVSGFGHSGRYSSMDTWGPTAQSFNGLTFMSGLPDEKPAGWGWSYMDTMAGYKSAFAALTALYHSKKTGEGQYVDLSQVESGISFNGASLLDFAVNGRKTRRPGFPTANRSVGSDPHTTGFRGEVGAPYNVYATKGGGDYDYCVISVLKDEEWEQFKTALEHPEWASDERFHTARGRIEAQETLDQFIAQWSVHHDKYDIMSLLQKHGVPCAALQSPEDRMENDPQLRHRNIFPSLEHPLLGTHRFENIPFRMSATQPELQPHWPILGKDNDYVLGGILGMSESEIQDLKELGITWPKGMPDDIIFEKSLW